MSLRSKAEEDGVSMGFSREGVDCLDLKSLV